MSYLNISIEADLLETDFWRTGDGDRNRRAFYISREPFGWKLSPTAVRRPSSASVDHHSATVARDLWFFPCADNLNLVCGEAKELETVGSYGSNVIAVLSDAAGEDEKVDTTEESSIRTDYLAHGNRKDIQRKSGLRIGADARFHRLHIALPGRESEEATMTVEQVFKLFGTEFLVAQKVEEYARVEVARARTHRDATGGSESHGGVNGYSVAQSAEACPVTKVGEDGSPRKLRAEVMHERLVRKTMETIAPNTCVEISLRKR